MGRIIVGRDRWDFWCQPRGRKGIMVKRRAHNHYIFDQDEPIEGMCWECGPKASCDDVKCHRCPECKRYWVMDRFIDSFQTPEDLDSFLKDKVEAEDALGKD